MAEALLGVDFEIHGGGVDLIFPHHENEAAQTLAGARASRSRGSGCTTGWSSWRRRRRREDVQVGRQHPRPRRGARRGRPRRADHVLHRAATTASRWPSRPSASTTRRGGSSGSATPAAGSCRATRRRSSRRTATRSSTPSPTTSTPRGRSPRCPSGSARRTAATRRRRRAPARDARRAGAREPARAAARARRPRSPRWPSGAPRRARARDFAEADRLRDELLRPGLGRPRRPGRARAGPAGP